MTELKLKGYWGVMRDRVNIEEWEYCCLEAMKGETFHKIPTPALLMEYVRGHRKLTRQQQEHAQRQTLQLMAPEESLEKVRALIAGVFKDDRLKDPIPPYEETP